MSTDRSPYSIPDSAHEDGANGLLRNLVPDADFEVKHSADPEWYREQARAVLEAAAPALHRAWGEERVEAVARAIRARGDHLVNVDTGVVFATEGDRKLARAALGLDDGGE